MWNTKKRKILWNGSLFVLLKLNKTQKYALWEREKMRLKYQVKIKWGPEWNIGWKAKIVFLCWIINKYRKKEQDNSIQDEIRVKDYKMISYPSEQINSYWISYSILFSLSKNQSLKDRRQWWFHKSSVLLTF